MALTAIRRRHGFRLLKPSLFPMTVGGFNLKVFTQRQIFKLTLYLARIYGIGSVNIPNSVTSIETRAFVNCKALTSITIPSSVKSIGQNAFAGCTSLKSVTIPNSVTNIGDGAFQKTGLTSVTIPNNVTSIGSRVFNDCNGLTSVTIPSSVKSIGQYAFSSDSITSVTCGGTIPTSGFNADAFDGDIRAKFYATDKNNGTAGTYTKPDGKSKTWTKK